ncbi:MAG: tetratricopeptide repeat protein [Deltaproteobacteria bacterium]|nr:tetratricopeptide repeat protein [Deltaproteobacteria bacterium]
MPDTAPVASDPTPQSDRLLLEEWTPLARCLAWRVGRLAWQPGAVDLFADETVPHLIHDNGAMSQRSAAVLFAWCEDQEAAGTLPGQIVVCEFGIGTGLHLRYLLDAFAQRCQQAAVDWYDRLQVLATDVSAAVARQAVERGLFASHAGRVRFGFLDIENPRQFIELDTGARLDLGGQVHFAIALYVLDLLTVDVFRRLREGDTSRWEAVLVRTWLRDPRQLPAYTDASAADLQALAAAPDGQNLAPLTDAWNLVQQELRAWAVDLSEHPDLPLLEQWADRQEVDLGTDHELLRDGTVVVHSAGALRALLGLTQILAPNGAALLRDVALATAEQAGHPRGHAHYGQVTAAAVNVRAIDQFFAAGLAPQGVRLLAPEHDGARGQATRLLVLGELAATQAAFAAVFDAQAVDAAQTLMDQALQQSDAAAVLEGLRQAIALEPTDWTLHLEAARVALDRLGRADLAHVIALHALEQNPNYSPDLWCVLGDASHAQGEPAQALAAYRNALQVHPRHVRSLFSLAWVEAERGRHGVAFELLGQALRWDRPGRYRGDILQLLDVCLRAQALQWQTERRRAAERDAL